MILSSFNNFIQNPIFYAIFPHRAQSVYLRRKSDQFFQIVYYHGDIILTKIYNIQDNIISYLDVITLFPKIVDQKPSYKL